MNKLILWLARDRDGKLYLYTNKPKRVVAGFYSVGSYMRIDPDKFPDLKWEDEPREITIEL